MIKVGDLCQTTDSEWYPLFEHHPTLGFGPVFTNDNEICIVLDVIAAFDSLNLITVLHARGKVFADKRCLRKIL